MNRRERMFNLLDNKAIDRTPVGFWLHFPEEEHSVRAAIDAHMDFVQHTQTDILKIMNENIFYDGTTKIRSSGDLHKFRGYSKKDKVFQDQMDIIRQIADRAQGEYPIVATIHGLIASAFHETGFSGNYNRMGYCFPLFCRENPRAMKDAFEAITASLIELVDCSLEAGAEGIFYAALGGERTFFTREEYEEFIVPYEGAIYNHIKQKTKLNILHICKNTIELERFTYLEPAVVNWSVYTNGVSLAQGSELFKDSIMLGGFPDRQGVLVSGSQQQIKAHTRTVLDQMRGKRLIVGADCTLPTEISYERIKEVVDAVRTLEGCMA